MSRRGLYTIAPHGRFLELLAARVLDGTLLGGWPREGPFWLADVTIFLPTRRARLALAACLARQAGGATLLPDIRTLGNEDAAETPFLPPHDAPLAAPEVGRLERRLTLGRLVRAFAAQTEAYATPPAAAEIFWLADSLAELLDDLEIEGVAAAKLAALVPAELAANWQESLAFLDIVLAQWPKILAGRGKVDAARARNDRLARAAATADRFGARPVIVAGSTGSLPATAGLLKAIAALPRGAIVLPGLDTGLTPDQHAALLVPGIGEGHPQYGLARLLHRLGAGIGEVEELAGAGAARTALVGAALALAAETAHWPEQRTDPAAALDGLSIIAAPNIELEARAIAAAARQGLAAGQSVGIVARDQNLARRIAVELRRFAIETDDAAGTPLFQSAAGQLARQCLAAAASDGAPLDVVSLLFNAAVTFGGDRAEIHAHAARLDLRLRGCYAAPGLAGLIAQADAAERHLLERLGAALAPLFALAVQPLIDAPALARALGDGVAAICGEARPRGYAEFLAWVEELAVVGDPGPDFAPRATDGVLAALMAGYQVAGAARRRDDIHIWGELEARLHNPDLMVLAGVNEDFWPAAADPGPWLSRGMRIGIGLEPPERRQGQAAHDFLMALGNKQVVIAYAERLGTSPALPSRFIQRLDAFVGAGWAGKMRARGGVWLEAARALDATGPPRPAPRPAPRPPAHLRPRKLSVTEIETLVRSPYELYARHVLKLRPLRRLGAEPEARDYGTLIHEVLAQFIAQHDVNAPLASLLAIADVAVAKLGLTPARRELWRKRVAGTAEEFLAYERARDARVARRFTERRGEVTLPLAEPFVLTGRADRLDRLIDGTVEIIDFKTGQPPSKTKLLAFEAPQLPLEAAMVAAGAFAGLPRRVSALTYIRLARGPEGFDPRSYATDEIAGAIDEVWRRAQSHIEALLLSDRLPMTARIMPVKGARFAGDYDHLARTDEWTLAAGTEEE